MLIKGTECYKALKISLSIIISIMKFPFSIVITPLANKMSK